MNRVLVLGAGPVGCWCARSLSLQGDEVTVASRSGTSRLPLAEGVRLVAADAADRKRMRRLVEEADVVVNAMNPSSYGRWAAEWPAMADSVLEAVRTARRRYVLVGNLYAYGPSEEPLVEDAPLWAVSANGRIRRRIWEHALAAHRTGETRVCEVRSSDYLGPGSAAGSVAHMMVLSRVRAGRRPVLLVGGPDVPHSYTDVRTVGQLVARLAREPWHSDAWGRAWHTPSDAPATFAELVSAERAGTHRKTVPRPVVLPRSVLRLAAFFSRDLRALLGTRYQFDRPFVVDSGAAESRFGIRPVPLAQSVRDTD